MNKTVVPTELWSRQETADFLGVPLQTISSWRARGKGPRGIRVGKYLRFDPADVTAWLESQKDPA